MANDIQDMRMTELWHICSIYDKRTISEVRGGFVPQYRQYCLLPENDCTLRVCDDDTAIPREVEFHFPLSHSMHSYWHSWDSPCTHLSVLWREIRDCWMGRWHWLFVCIPLCCDPHPSYYWKYDVRSAIDTACQRNEWLFNPWTIPWGDGGNGGCRRCLQADVSDLVGYFRMLLLGMLVHMNKSINIKQAIPIWSGVQKYLKG